MSQSANPLARDLEEAVADLGAALGAALTALDNPAVAIAQLTKLVTVAKATAKGRHIELASHWRMADVLLAAKTTNPADDTPVGGDE